MALRRAIIAVYTLSWVGIICIIGAIVLAPLLKVRHPQVSGFFYILFAPFCHQIPARCFRLAGFPLAVCARCFGIYAGFGAGLILYPFRRGFREVRTPALRAFLLISGSIAIDVAGNMLRFWDSSPWIRFGPAVLWGTFLPFFFVTGLVDAWDQVRQRRRGPEAPGPVRS
jgi:uncharacterized membrane protein